MSKLAIIGHDRSQLVDCSEVIPVPKPFTGQAMFPAGLSNADIEQAVEGAIASKFRHTGQTCVCANRIFVHSSVYADFASRLAEKVAAFKVGDGLDPST